MIAFQLFTMIMATRVTLWCYAILAWIFHIYTSIFNNISVFKTNSGDIIFLSLPITDRLDIIKRRIMFRY